MTIPLEDIENVWQQADCLWSEQQVERAIDQTAADIETQLAHKNPLLLCVMNGGLVYTAKLMLRLQFPLQQDYVHATRYQQGVSGHELSWNVEPGINVAGRHVLIIDDILDEGVTLSAIIDACQQKGAEEVLTTVLVEKQHQRKTTPDFHADFTALTVADHYVFGYGMDYKGYLRNAVGIFAAKEA